MQTKRELILTMDSSGPKLCVGLYDGNKLHTAYHTGIKQEQFVQTLIRKVLGKAGAEMTDIQKVFFVRGPGRFTGIRISLTFASMLQYLNGATPMSATIFDILMRQVAQSHSFDVWKEENPDGIAAVVLHAFREEYFLQFFDGSAEGPQWLSKEELLLKLAARNEPLYCVGLDKEGESLQPLLGDKYRLAPVADCRVRMGTLAEMAEDSMYEKEALEPLYLKPARFELGK